MREPQCMPVKSPIPTSFPGSLVDEENDNDHGDKTLGTRLVRSMGHYAD